MVVLIPSLAFGQLGPDLPKDGGHISSIVVKQFGRLSARIVDQSGKQTDVEYGYGFTGQTTTQIYGSNDQMISREVKMRKSLLFAETYVWDTLNGKASVRINRSVAIPGLSGVFITETEFDGRSRPVSCRGSWQSATSEESFTQVHDYGAAYADSLLTSYERVYMDSSGDTLLVVMVELEYDTRGRLIARVERVQGEHPGDAAATGQEPLAGNLTMPQASIRRDYVYDPTGRLATITERQLGDQHGERTKDVARTYSFSYDKRGNWTKKFVKVGDSAKQLVQSRRIRYRVS